MLSQNVRREQLADSSKQVLDDPESTFLGPIEGKSNPDSGAGILVSTKVGLKHAGLLAG